MNDIFEEIFKRLEEQIDNHTQTLSYGGVESFHNYTELVGRITGLRLAQTEVQDVVEMVRRQEEEDK